MCLNVNEYVFFVCNVILYYLFTYFCMLVLVLFTGLSDHVVHKREEMVTALCQGVAVVTEAVRQLHLTRLRYWSLASAIVFGLALLCLFSDLPSLYSRTFQVSLIVLTALALFSVVMATIWHNIEWNGLRSSMMAMQFLANRFSYASPSETGSSVVSDTLI